MREGRNDRNQKWLQRKDEEKEEKEKNDCVKKKKRRRTDKDMKQKTI